MSAEAGMQAWLCVARRNVATTDSAARSAGTQAATTPPLKHCKPSSYIDRSAATCRSPAACCPAAASPSALERSYAKLHSIIYRKPHDWRARTLMLFREEIPEVVHELRGAIFWVTLLFVLSAGAGWWLVSSYPELISLLADEQTINQRRARPAVDRGHAQRRALLDDLARHPVQQHRREPDGVLRRRVLRAGHVLYHRHQRADARRDVRFHAPAWPRRRAAEVRHRARRGGAVGDLYRRRRGHHARRSIDSPDASDPPRIVSARRHQGLASCCCSVRCC